MEALSGSILKPTLGSPVLHKTTRKGIVSRTQFPGRLFFLNSTPDSNPIPFKSHLSCCSISSSNTLFGTNLINSKDVVLSRERPVGTVDNLSNSSFDLGGRDYVGMVVLLGWLGAEEKSLRGMAKWYNSRGFRTITFLVDLKEIIRFDLGRSVEARVTALANELANWVCQSEEDSRQRILLVHTFSNTGWLVYMALIARWVDRDSVLEKIKGCVVDSGGVELVNPKVWAAGWCVALLKKYSSVTYPAKENQNLESESQVSPSKNRGNWTSLIETILCFAIEIFLTSMVSLPYNRRRIYKSVTVPSARQPSCPRLYLYSTADKVIPSESLESFLEAQRKKGRKVFSYNFMSSPHVEHYVIFPNIYLSLLENFLKECLSDVKKAN